MSNSSDDSSLFKCSFGHDIVKEALKSKFMNPKNKISDDAVELISEIAKIIVIEATLRAVDQANSENKKKVSLEHVETILPQIMLDFP
ncbi:centromere protein X-like [Anoplophora glabripennis]|uniref:centromere protein X-like n=1 Tax=Anoplophora glabripennis TaxID=217634 RepID=UPI0008737289|nr:centromere protein X-like [Anoplophora glabripennis]